MCVLMVRILYVFVILIFKIYDKIIFKKFIEVKVIMRLKKNCFNVFKDY